MRRIFYEELSGEVRFRGNIGLKIVSFLYLSEEVK
jgi:hypothetical protein